jgi:hypothetical protein
MTQSLKPEAADIRISDPSRRGGISSGLAAETIDLHPQRTDFWRFTSMKRGR